MRIRMNRLAAELDDLGGADITGALEDLPVRSFVIDADGVVRWQNAASRTAIGDWAGRKWVELVSEKQTEELEGVVRRMFCSGDPAEVTFDVREADGEMARREVSAAPLRDGGAVVGLFGVSVPVGTQGTQAVASGSSPLTERQLEVLQLLAEGKSTSQIADDSSSARPRCGITSPTCSRTWASTPAFRRSSPGPGPGSSAYRRPTSPPTPAEA